MSIIDSTFFFYPLCLHILFLLARVNFFLFGTINYNAYTSVYDFSFWLNNFSPSFFFPLLWFLFASFVLFLYLYLSPLSPVLPVLLINILALPLFSILFVVFVGSIFLLLLFFLDKNWSKWRCRQTLSCQGFCFVDVYCIDYLFLSLCCFRFCACLRKRVRLRNF